MRRLIEKLGGGLFVVALLLCVLAGGALVVATRTELYNRKPTSRITGPKFHIDVHILSAISATLLAAAGAVVGFTGLRIRKTWWFVLALLANLGCFSFSLFVLKIVWQYKQLDGL